MEKKLYRISSNRSYLGGVSEGLAEYFNIDVAIIRAIFIILVFTPFPAIITYLILWAVLPEVNRFITTDGSNTELINTTNSTITKMNKNNQNGSLIGGAILIIIGIILSFETILDIDIWHYIWRMWPLGLIALGVWMIVKDRPNLNNFNDNQ